MQVIRKGRKYLTCITGSVEAINHTILPYPGRSLDEKIRQYNGVRIGVLTNDGIDFVEFPGRLPRGIKARDLMHKKVEYSREQTIGVAGQDGLRVDFDYRLRIFDDKREIDLAMHVYRIID